MVNYNKFLERGLKNLRDSVGGLSLDKFIVRSIEILMLIEREEYLERVGDKDKGNESFLMPGSIVNSKHGQAYLPFDRVTILPLFQPEVWINHRPVF
jgi:hypothetical protein